MATITLKGTPVHTAGELPMIGTRAPDFTLTRASLENVRLADFAGKKKILNIVASLDTGVCATSAKRFELLSRALVVLDANDRVVYTQQVPEIAQEPDYAPALAAVKKS